MYILDDTSTLIRAVTGSAADIEIQASYVTNAAGTITPAGDVPTNMTSATTTTIIPSPGASEQIAVKAMSFYNNHASVSTAFQVEIYDGTDTAILWKGTLAPGEKLEYAENGVWYYYDSVGKLYTANGPIYVASLSGDQSNSTTSLTEVTGLSLALPTGTYMFEYNIVYQAAATTTGVRFSVNFDGTVTTFVANMSWVTAADASGTAINAPDQDVVTTNGGLMGHFAARAKSTTGWGTTISVDTANSDMLMVIKGLMVVTVAGNIELWHGSEVAAASTVKAGASLVVTKVA